MLLKPALTVLARARIRATGASNIAVVKNGRHELLNVEKLGEDRQQRGRAISFWVCICDPLNPRRLDLMPTFHRLCSISEFITTDRLKRVTNVKNFLKNSSWAWTKNSCVIKNGLS
ncbi:unnamed protein product [Nesidiocoris tenuis]|uniref:Uncharacterized protein n=1 Tax=Nesidiocoris tenuis TaxID=355587 RepID=A0A6H5GEU6_9HEMI|nr:unnamed protein product [Nesidiocoris tenuis]